MSTALRALIANDAYAATFQTIGQYRAALLKVLATAPQVGMISVGSCALLAHWIKRFAEIEAAYKATRDVLGCTPDSPLIAALYGTFEDYTKTLAKVVGDEDGWLDWYIWENDAGKKGLAAKAVHQKKEAPVKTLDDLCRILNLNAEAKPLAGASSGQSD